MQKIINHILLFIFSVTILSSCTKFENGKFVEEDVLPPSNGQYILLEEYTAQQCPNCPEGAKKAASLQSVFGDKVIVVGIHVGPLAKASYAFPLKLSSAAGDAYDAHYNCSEALPKGMVSRLVYNGSAVMETGDWAAVVRKQFEAQPFAEMSLNANIEGDSSLKISSNVKFIKDYSGTGSVNIITWVVEDSIVGKQKLTGQPDIPNYVHRHVLRACVDADPWGTLFTESTVAKDFTKTQSYTFSLKGQKWVHKNLYVVSFICDASTKSVIQVVEKHVSI